MSAVCIECRVPSKRAEREADSLCLACVNEHAALANVANRLAAEDRP